MTIRVCVAGATGWTGSAVTAGVLDEDDLELTGAVARSAAGSSLSEVVGAAIPRDLVVSADVATALEAGADVLIDYTHPSAVKANALIALEQGVHVVIGTSGLDADDYVDIAGAAERTGCGVIAAGNFSVTAALLKHFSGIAARHVPHWEVIDMAHAGKPDAPSGTARELADYLGELATNELKLPVDETLGTPETRGATIGGAQVHALRLPGFVLSMEALFGLPGERLTIRHDAGTSAEPYVGGTLLAVRAAPETKGLVRGLDTLLFGS